MNATASRPPDLRYSKLHFILEFALENIDIPDAILLKEGSLTDSEWQEIRTHPEKGFHIVSKMPGMQDAGCSRNRPEP